MILGERMIRFNLSFTNFAKLWWWQRWNFGWVHQVC